MFLVFAIIAAAYACRMLAMFRIGGNHPSYIRAARPEQAVPLYDRYCAGLESALGRPVARGIFGADMKVSLINDGPVTILLESRDGAIL